MYRLQVNNHIFISSFKLITYLYNDSEIVNEIDY